MVYLIFVVVILFLLFLTDIVKGYRVRASVYASPEEFEAVFSFLRPLLNVQLDINANRQMFTAKVLGVPVLKKRIILQGKQKGTFNAMRFLRSAELRNIAVETAYGFNNPFYTGFIFIIFDFLAEWFGKKENVESIGVHADYLSSEDYLRASAHGDFCLSHTILNYIKKEV